MEVFLFYKRIDHEWYNTDDERLSINILINMKKLTIGMLMGIVLIAIGSYPVMAKEWKPKAPQQITFVCGGTEYNHSLNTISTKGRNFTGTGMWNADVNYTWDISGAIENNTIRFTIDYTGSNPDYFLKGTGAVSDDGSVSGNITEGNCETFTMKATEVVSKKKENHGQFVKSASDKRAAAYSRVGMPEQSKGHTR